MSVQVAHGIGASIGLVIRRLNDLRAGITRTLVMRVHVGPVDEDAHRRDLGLARALHPPVLAALSHHDALAIERHLRMHPAWSRVSHLFGEPEGTCEPVERGGYVTIENVRND